MNGDNMAIDYSENKIFYAANKDELLTSYLTILNEVVFKLTKEPSQKERIEIFTQIRKEYGEHIFQRIDFILRFITHGWYEIDLINYKAFTKELEAGYYNKYLLPQFHFEKFMRESQ
jgi:hypothetical protein